MGLPTIRSLSAAYLSSLAIAVGLVVASAAGLAGDPYGTSALVLVSRGADAANLVLVLPILLGSMWLARRGSLIGLLLWPGALFYVLYAYVPYVVGAPFTALFFVHVGLVTLSAFTIIGILASIDAADVRQRLARAPARSVGGALVVIALLAYAGLIGVAISALGDPTTEAATRPLAVADWVVGTPVLVVGGLLLLGRAALGYVVAPGLLLVSGLGGVAFAIAAVARQRAGQSPDRAGGHRHPPRDRHDQHRASRLLRPRRHQTTGRRPAGADQCAPSPAADAGRQELTP